LIPGFQAQGGDPTGTGMNGPGYQYAGEFDPKLKHTKGGLLSMGERGPEHRGSQFSPHVRRHALADGKHTIFGEITAGMDTHEEAGREGHAERQDDRAVKS